MNCWLYQLTCLSSSSSCDSNGVSQARRLATDETLSGEKTGCAELGPDIQTFGGVTGTVGGLATHHTEASNDADAPARAQRSASPTARGGEWICHSSKAKLKHTPKGAIARDPRPLAWGEPRLRAHPTNPLRLARADRSGSRVASLPAGADTYCPRQSGSICPIVQFPPLHG